MITTDYNRDRVLRLLECMERDAKILRARAHGRCDDHDAAVLRGIEYSARDVREYIEHYTKPSGAAGAETGRWTIKN